MILKYGTIGEFAVLLSADDVAVLLNV